MASELDKWARRNAYPVDLGDGVTGYVTPMQFGEIRTAKNIDDQDDRTVFYLACSVCDESGKTLVARNENESLSNFVSRASDFFAVLSPVAITKAMEAVAKVATATEQPALVKN